MQLLFSEIRNRFLRALTAPTIEDVDAAYESLMDPAHRAYFDYWKQRLHEELGPPEDGQAVEILHAAAKDPNGATRATLLGVLSRHVQEPRERETRLHELLDVLRSDGYLVEHDGRIVFRSSMLRDFWLRRVMP